MLWHLVLQRHAVCYVVDSNCCSSLRRQEVEPAVLLRIAEIADSTHHQHRLAKGGTRSEKTRPFHFSDLNFAVKLTHTKKFLRVPKEFFATSNGGSLRYHSFSNWAGFDVVGEFNAQRL